jgi:hypothetical protein
MNSYASSGPQDLLSQYFGGEVTDLSWGGSGLDYQERNLIDRIISDQPEKALVIWGLSFWDRFELGYRYFQNGNSSLKYMQFNSGMILDSHTFGDYYHKISNLPDQLFEHRLFISEAYVKQNLQTLITVSGWLRSLGHEYIIFNQIEDHYQYYLRDHGEYRELFNSDSGFVDLGNFEMLDYLYANGVQPDPQDLEQFGVIEGCHPIIDDTLKRVMTNYIIQYYEKNHEATNC